MPHWSAYSAPGLRRRLLYAGELQPLSAPPWSGTARRDARVESRPCAGSGHVGYRSMPGSSRSTILCPRFPRSKAIPRRYGLRHFPAVHADRAVAVLRVAGRDDPRTRLPCSPRQISQLVRLLLVAPTSLDRFSLFTQFDAAASADVRAVSARIIAGISLAAAKKHHKLPVYVPSPCQLILDIFNWQRSCKTSIRSPRVDTTFAR